MKFIVTTFLALLSLQVLAARPASYTELLDYVQEAPDQGETNTCLFMASTGAMELIANKVNGIKNPQPYGPFDLSESWVIWAPDTMTKGFWDTPVLRFNNGYGVHTSEWPYEAWSEYAINNSVWTKHPNFSKLPQVKLPKVETVTLFQRGGRWSTNVIGKAEIDQIKEALWKYKSPVLVNYNDEDYWHVILIVGYDDTLNGECYDTDPKECSADVGSFYIRDSFGVKVEVRDYDWFRVKGNTAIVVKPI